MEPVSRWLPVRHESLAAGAGAATTVTTDVRAAGSDINLTM